MRSTGTLVTASKRSNIKFTNCTFEHTEQATVSITQTSRDRGVTDSIIEEVGTIGVILGCGVRSSLTNGNGYVRNTRVTNFSRIHYTSKPTIKVGGCGNSVKHSPLEGSTHEAIVFYATNMKSATTKFGTCAL